MPRLHFLAAVILLSAGHVGSPLLAEESFSSGKAGFAVRVDGQVFDYQVFGIYVLPGKEISVEVLTDGGKLEFEIGSTAIRARQRGPRRWILEAPLQPGTFAFEIRPRDDREVMLINVFVMVPYRPSQGDRVDGYRIGAYPKTALRGLRIYEPPRGLIQVEREDLTVKISPHFTLGQFLCKQEGGFPKFLVLREQLLLKLEYLLRVVNANGYHSQTFQVLSGYRTPFYNQAIGNVRYSRHQWGGAADIFIDEDPRDGIMDDLNADGRIDRQDAEVLLRLFENLSSQPSYEPLVGGLGLYGTTANHGPFVHVDARGFRARW